jgi:hypothetical protein
MGEMDAYRILVGKSEGKNHCDDKDVGWWIILKLILERENGMVWIGLIWLRTGSSMNTVMNLRIP